MPIEAASARIGRLVRARAGAIVIATIVASAGFGVAIALVPSYPSSDAFDADTAIVRAMQRIERDLPPRGFVIPFVVEGAGGNALAREAFDEVLVIERTLRDDPMVAPLVYEHQDPNLRMRVSSVWSFPDTMRAVMAGETPLAYAIRWPKEVGGPGVTYEEATDEEWNVALSKLLDFEDPRHPGQLPFRRALSQDARNESGRWVARSVFAAPLLDYPLLFGKYARDPALATPERPLFEEVQLHVQDVADAHADATAWRGIALGINTEIKREVTESSKLVSLAFVAIAVVLAVTLRSWRDFLVATLSLPLLVVWMLGGARLLGLSENQFTAMLPVLILALGVDYAIHGVRRYAEERATHEPGEAVERAVRLLGPALFLAAGTTAAAFASNAFTTISGLRDWAIEGAIAISAALWLCGAFAPALRYLWDRRRIARGRDAPARRSSSASRGSVFGRLAAGASCRPVAVLAIVGVATVPMGVAALGITTDFDAKDFFDNTSEFITNLDVIGRDFPDEGEPAVLLVEGDVGDPRVVAALASTIERLKPPYAPEREHSIAAVVQAFMRYPEENGAEYADADGDDVPDRAEDLRALLATALRSGVFVRAEGPPEPIVPGLPPVGPFAQPSDVRVLAYSPEAVRELVHPTGGGGYDLTAVVIGIPNTDDFAKLPGAAADVREAAHDLHALEGDAVTRVTLTGEPFKRLEQVNAITDNLRVSVALSVVLCFLIVLLAFRDVLFSVATILPVLLLIPWLYGFMALAGLALNIVTATIAAMAIGVGIDYSIHLTERFREEHEKNGLTPSVAIRRAVDTSGVALLGSAATTVLGFLVLLLAPMPLFRNFGMLTAAMAATSFLAALVVLPPILVLVANRRARRGVPVQQRAATTATAEDAPAPSPR